MPTQLRGQGSALANVCAMIANFFAPQIVYSKIVDQRMPFILMGIVSLFAAILAIFLPETAGIKLPDTVAEAEVLFKRKKNFHKNSDKMPSLERSGMKSSNVDSDGYENHAYLWIKNLEY